MNKPLSLNSKFQWIVDAEIYYVARPRVHNAFQNQDQDQAQIKDSFTMDFLKPTVMI